MHPIRFAAVCTLRLIKLGRQAKRGSVDSFAS